MKRFLSLLAAATFLLVASGCGQSGPLYIPGNPSKIQSPPPQAESAAEEASEEDGNTEKKE